MNGRTTVWSGREMARPVCIRVPVAPRRSGRAFGDMNTNMQRHTDFIWSIEWDKSGILIAVAALAVVGLLLVLFVRRRQRQ